MVPKWTLEASGNVCGRRSATEGGKHVFLRPSGRQKNEEKLLGGYRGDFERERRGDGAGTLLAQAPRGGTISKEKRLDNNFKQDLTRRWAAGPANLIYEKESDNAFRGPGGQVGGPGSRKSPREADVGDAAGPPAPPKLTAQGEPPRASHPPCAKEIFKRVAASQPY